MSTEHDRPGASGADERPTPQYGEYAPPGWSWRPPEPTPDDRPTDPVPSGASPVMERTPTGNAIDRILTIALLAMGAAFALPALVNPGAFARMLDEQYALQGIGTYGSPQLATALGLVSALAQTAVVVIATIIAVRRLRQGKRALLVPVIGIVVTVVVSIAISAIAILADPTFLEYVNRMTAPSPSAS